MRWAEDGPGAPSEWKEDSEPATHVHSITKCSSCGDLIEQCRCMGPKVTRYAVCDACSGRTALRNAPSKPYFTDEYKPTDPVLWERCLEIVNGERRQFTQSGRTIHAPNHGRGYRHMPNPKGIAWAVKQYNGFGGGWKNKDEGSEGGIAEQEGTNTAALRLLASGGVVLALPGELDALGRQGLARVAGEAHGRVYWDATARGVRVALSGLVEELTRRMEALLRDFDPAESKALGEWLDANFRVSSPKTPKGGKAIKEKLQRLLWVLKFRYSSTQDPDPTKIVTELQRDWEAVQKDRAILLKFTDEGGTVVPSEIKVGGVTYVNDAGVTAAQLEKYSARLALIFKSIKGWRSKSLAGNLVVKLKPPAAFNGTVTGKYKREEDSMWVRTTPAVLKRGAGYASFEYILVHELGHRYERHHSLPLDFDRPDWWTTRYSRDDGESFAELFALGHFGLTGSWDSGILERFENVMKGKEKV